MDNDSVARAKCNLPKCIKLHFCQGIIIAIKVIFKDNRLRIDNSVKFA